MLTEKVDAIVVTQDALFSCSGGTVDHIQCELAHSHTRKRTIQGTAYSSSKPKAVNLNQTGQIEKETRCADSRSSCVCEGIPIRKLALSGSFTAKPNDR